MTPSNRRTLAAEVPAPVEPANGKPPAAGLLAAMPRGASAMPLNEERVRAISRGLAEKGLAIAGRQPALAPWLIAVVYIFSAGWLGVTLLPHLIQLRSDGIPPNLRSTAPGLDNMFVRWDAGYYWAIAQNGYRPAGSERAFFPLYPLLVRWLSELDRLPLGWNGLVISIAAFGGAAALFYAWVRRDHGRQPAFLASVLLCFSPVAFYFVAFYAEGLYLLTTIASLYFARRGWFLASGLAIALAGATRPTAFLLGFAYVFECLQQRPLSRRAWLGVVLGAVVAPSGALAYYLYLGQPQGVLAGLATYNQLLLTEWQTRMAWPWELVMDALRALVFQTGIHPGWFSWSYSLQDFLWAALGLALAVWAARHLRLSTAVFLLVSLGYVFTLHGPYDYAFDSAPRHVGTVIPIYLALALFISLKIPKYRWAVLAVSGLWLGVLTAWFTSGRWVS